MREWPKQPKHPDLGRSAMYDGIRCKVWGVTYGARNLHPKEIYADNPRGYYYHLMPAGKREIWDIIQYVPFDKLAFDLPPETVAVSCGMSAQIISFEKGVL